MLIGNDVSGCSVQPSAEKSALAYLTQAIILASDVDQLKQKLESDPSFRAEFFETIQVAPLEESRMVLADKIFQVVSPDQRPSWTEALAAVLVKKEEAEKARSKEQKFLEQCAQGLPFPLPEGLDFAEARDVNGRTALHLALTSPACTMDLLKALIASCPKLLFVKDYDQLLPLELVRRESPVVELVCKLAIEPNKSFEIPLLIALLAKMQNSHQAFAYFSKLLELYSPQSKEDFFLNICHPLRECAGRGQEGLARELVMLIAEKLKLPKYPLLCAIFPAWVAAEVITDIRQQTPEPSSYFSISRYREWLNCLDLTGIDAGEITQLQACALRPILNLNALLKARYFDKIESYFCAYPEKFPALLVLSLPQTSCEADAFVQKLICEHVKDNAAFQTLIQDLWASTEGFPDRRISSSDSVALIQDLVRNNLGAIEHKMVATLALLLAPGFFSEVLGKWSRQTACRFHAKPHVLELARSWVDEKTTYSAERCLEAIKSIVSIEQKNCCELEAVPERAYGDNFKLSLHEELILAIPSKKGRGEALLSYLLGYYGVTDLAFIERFIRLALSRVRLKPVEPDMQSLYISRIEGILTVLLNHRIGTLKEGEFLIDGLLLHDLYEVLSSLQDHSDKEGCELLSAVFPFLENGQLVSLIMKFGLKCVKFKPGILSLLSSEIKRRPKTEDICKLLAENPAMFITDQESFKSCSSVLELLLSQEFDHLKTQMTALLNSEIAKIRPLSTQTLQDQASLELLKTLVDRKLDITPLLDIESLHSIASLASNKDLFHFLVFQVLRKLSVYPAPCNKRTANFSVLEELYDDLLANLPGLKEGAVEMKSPCNLTHHYEVKANGYEKTVTIFRHDPVSQTKHPIFYGYIAYDRLVETIKMHDRTQSENISISRLKDSPAARFFSTVHQVPNPQYFIEIEGAGAMLDDSKQRTITLYLAGPGRMQVDTRVFSYAELHDNPQALEELKEEWIGKVSDLYNSLADKVGKDCCFFPTEKEAVPPPIPYLKIDGKTGQILCITQAGFKREVHLCTIEKAPGLFHRAKENLSYIETYVQWAMGKEGLVFPERAGIIGDIFESLIPYFENKWICLPWSNKGCWLFARNPGSGLLLNCPTSDGQERDKILQGLLDLSSALGDFVPDQKKLNDCAAKSGETIHQNPGKAPLRLLIDLFGKMESSDWLAEEAKRFRSSVPSLKSNLLHFIKAVEEKSIQGWEGASYEGNYRDLQAYITNTLDRWQNADDGSGLRQFVFEVALYGRHCGSKVMEVAYQYYALAFGFQNMESAADDIGQIIAQSYPKAFLQALDLLISFIGDPKAKSQSIHVLSYLRVKLSKLGYSIPDDPRVAPAQQNGKNDMFHLNWGKEDYPREILAQLFPGILLPLFLQELQKAQREWIEGERWEALANLTKALREGIEMELEKNGSFQALPDIQREFRDYKKKREEALQKVKLEVDCMQNELDKINREPDSLVSKVQDLEGALSTISASLKEASENCLRLSKRRQQVERALQEADRHEKNLALSEDGKKRKISSLELSSEKEDLLGQRDKIASRQRDAEEVVEKRKAEARTIQAALENANAQVQLFKKRYELTEKLEGKKREYQECSSDKHVLTSLVMKIAESEGFLEEGPYDSTILSLKGLVQLLKQKGLLVRSCS